MKPTKPNRKERNSSVGINVFAFIYVCNTKSKNCSKNMYVTVEKTHIKQLNCTRRALKDMVLI